MSSRRQSPLWRSPVESSRARLAAGLYRRPSARLAGGLRPKGPLLLSSFCLKDALGEIDDQFDFLGRPLANDSL